MFWNKNISTTEYWFLAVFFLIYFLYFIKIIYLSKKLKVTARATFLKFIPRTATFTLLIIALLEPSFGNNDEISKTKLSSKVIYFLVDLSKSMDATDVAPSRIEKTKNEIKKILNYFTTDKFGIIAFASEPTLITPITNDYNNLKAILGLLNTNIPTETGTNLIAALKFGIDKIALNPNYATSPKAIVVFTDGEDFADVNENILNDFKKRRIKLILIGIGTKNGAILSEKASTKSNKNALIKTKLQSEYLKSLANKTNGKYFELNDELNPISEIIDNLATLTGSNIGLSTNAANPGNKYHYPLILAVLMICLDFLFVIRIFKF
jgi:Ca-activated chloride channel homolog